MSCCKDPYLMDDKNECGCVFQACFNCNDWSMVTWCKQHNPEGDE